MRIFFPALFFTVLAMVSIAPAQEAWVRQTDLGIGLVYDMPVAGTGGTYAAPLPVSETGARFELFAKGTAWDSNIYLLDTKLIRAYSPLASLSLASEDPYIRGDATSGTYVKRTRADRPFSFNIHVGGLVPSSAILAERAVYLGIQGRNYDPVTYSSLERPEYLLHEYNLSNGDISSGQIYHELTPGALTAACGEQTFTFVRYASDGVPDTILAQPKMEIWPVASAEVERITTGQVFNDRVPPIPLTLRHLYPDSRTYAQVYPGPSVIGTKGTVIGGTERRFGRYYNPDQAEEPTNVPQDLALSIDDLSKYAAADGIYTLEVVTETPFMNREPERLISITFEVDRVISSRGQLSTTEKNSP